jgi:hypothetical protein
MMTRACERETAADLGLRSTVEPLPSWGRRELASPHVSGAHPKDTGTESVDSWNGGVSATASSPDTRRAELSGSPNGLVPAQLLA